MSMTNLSRCVPSQPAPDVAGCRSQFVNLPQANRVVPVAREIAKQTLAAWELSGLLDRVALVVSELVTNAVQHSDSERREVRLVLLFSEETLQVEVHDGDPRLPRRLEPEIDAVGGWGLVLVEESSTQWGTHRDAAGGKCVWAVFAP